MDGVDGANRDTSQQQSIVNDHKFEQFTIVRYSRPRFVFDLSSLLAQSGSR